MDFCLEPHALAIFAIVGHYPRCDCGQFVVHYKTTEKLREQKELTNFL